MKRRIASFLLVAVCLAGAAIGQEQLDTGAVYPSQFASGVMAGCDVLFLKAFGNRYDQVAHELLFIDDFEAPSNDLEVSTRVWLSYVGESGFGVRTRWFQYEHTLQAGTGFAPDDDFPAEGRNHLKVYAVDLEFMQQFELGCWTTNAGAGIRAGGVTRRNTVDIVDANLILTQTSRFEGIGPSVFAEFKRPIAGSGFSMIANARGTVLFGDTTWGDDFLVEPISGRSDNVVGVGEMQLGFEYRRPIGYGAIGFVQCLWEGQVWSEASAISVDQVQRVHGERDHLGLAGIALSFGISR